MSFEDELWTYLTEDSSVAALVTDSEGTLNVYKTRLAEKTKLPAIAFFRVDAFRTYTYEPYPDPAFVRARVQFDCWSNVATEAQAVADAVLAALSGFSGDLGGFSVGASFCVDERDGYEPQSKKHRRALDFHISYEDAVPAAS